MNAIAGSWEDWLTRAMDAAGQNDDETDALFDKLITRLNKLPDRILLAGDGKLVRLRDRAVFRYTEWLLYQDRVEDALALVDRADHKLRDIVSSDWVLRRARILSQSDNVDEAEAAWLKIVSETEYIDDVEHAIEELIRLKRFGAAASVILQLPRLYEETEEDTVFSMHFYRARLFAHINRPAETRQEMRLLLKNDPGDIIVVDEFFETGWSTGFSPIDLLHLANAPEIGKDPPLRVQFWRAFAMQQLGRTDDANRLWRQLSSDKMLEEYGDKERLVWIWSVAKYYLGDPRSAGLAATLDTLHEWEDDVPYDTYASAAIGWALQGDETAMKLNVLQAESAFRRTTPRHRKHRIPQPWGTIAKDMLTPEQWAMVEKQFAEREHIQVEELEV